MKPATIAVCLAACLVYGAGLLSPLTPSEGAPGIGQLALFWALPIVALAAVRIWDRSTAGRSASAMLAALVLGSYGWIAYRLFAGT